MTDPQNTDTDDGMAFSRRSIIKTVGAAGTIGAIGGETVGAKKTNRYYVGTKPGKAHIAKREASEVTNVVEMEGIGPTVTGRWPEEARKGLRRNPHIRYIEEEQFDRPLYDLPDETLPWGIDRVDAEIAHDNGDTGSGVDVAVSDSGIDSDHPDLNTGTGYATSGAKCTSCAEDWDDTDGHGTHVSGTIGAIDNSEGVVGVAPDVTLHAVKIFPGGGHDQIKEGLKWAANQGYDVVNMSHGGSDSGPKRDGIEYANNKGMLLVAAAGNSGCCDNVEYPAAYDEVIAVSSTTDTDNLRGDSSRGSEIDIAAPGNDIPSTWNDGEYNNIGGTSMASPHVAGAGALLIADGKDAAGARTKLENSAKDIGLTDKQQGNGLLDVADALGHDSANDLLEVETDPADGLEWTEARLNGQLTQLTGSSAADVFFEWGPAGGGFPNSTSGTTIGGTGFFSEVITGLDEDTEYQFRGVVTNAEGSTERGQSQTFYTDNNYDPVARISQTPLTPNVGDTVNFDASTSDSGDFSGDSIVSYEWDLDNDGSFADASGPTASKTFTAGGSTTVKVRVTDEFGQTDIAAETFTVNEFPVSSFTHSPSEPNEGESVSFDASGAGDPDGTIVSYEWDFDNDGAFDDATGVNPSHTFTDGGDKTIGLRVTDDNGATDSRTKTFHVNEFPTSSFTHSPSEPNESEPVSFDASGSDDPDGTIVSYEWDFDDDGAFDDATGVNPSHTFTDGGDKTIGLRVTDDNGATDSTTKTFHVNHFPTASFTMSPDPVVRNETATFDASGSSDPDGSVVTYEWDWDNDGTFEESTNTAMTSHTFTTGGEHTVALRVTDDDGATSAPVTMTVTVYIRVAIDIKPNGGGQNPINPNGRGTVPVAVLHTSAFDPPSELDPSSVHFGDPDDVGFDSSDEPTGGAIPAHKGGHVEDGDGDGDMDFVFHFPIGDADFESADTEGELVGLTKADVPVFGTDSVKVVGKGGP